MKMKKNKGFTLIELLVVIAIIGLLSTLAVVALNNARAKSRDARRISDVKQVQTALEMFYNDCNGYPPTLTAGATLTGCASGVTLGTYMATIPTSPTPVDGDCTSTENTYTYTSESPNTTYSLAYCLGSSTGTLAAGVHTATPAGL